MLLTLPAQRFQQKPTLLSIIKHKSEILATPLNIWISHQKLNVTLLWKLETWQKSHNSQRKSNKQKQQNANRQTFGLYNAKFHPRITQKLEENISQNKTTYKWINNSESLGRKWNVELQIYCKYQCVQTHVCTHIVCMCARVHIYSTI